MHGDELCVASEMQVVWVREEVRPLWHSDHGLAELSSKLAQICEIKFPRVPLG